MEFQLKDIIIILSTFVTGLFTLGAVYLTNKINSSNSRELLAQVNLKEKEKNKLLKLEELYVKFDKWSQSFITTCFKYLHLSNSKSQTDVKLEFIELKMLVNIHFPELKSELYLVFQSRDKCAKLFTETHLSSELKAEMEGFELARTEFKKQIEKLSKALY
ncbi:hypothetical protein J8L73_14920 [Pseudoalteromonas sp. MMG006]|uniref:hypothetical protein n=1 Tax=Pseudoalteromonas sp. MMG006 TaxID=2822683 RepID=UPI001B38E148|nr:hypothetical protein [Pseudoalteromonas sp. MMG006]MBQ4800410.1 hypothetical protein [Pseudoalteromonas sp. MMG006]